jgi:hypothetical protein
MGPAFDRRPGKEVQLPALAHFRAVDPLPTRVRNQVRPGASTRGYERSREAAPNVKSRGASKSAASRHLVSRMGAKMREHLIRSLDDVQVKALAMDGACLTVVVALRILPDGTKAPRGLWQRSTENAAVCPSPLPDLRGARAAPRRTRAGCDRRGVRSPHSDHGRYVPSTTRGRSPTGAERDGAFSSSGVINRAVCGAAA